MNETEKPKPTFQTSNFRIFIVAAALGFPYIIFMTWAARHFLQPDDVDWLRDGAGTVLGLVVTLFGGGTVAGSLKKTFGKVAAQVAEKQADVMATAPDAPLQFSTRGKVGDTLMFSPEPQVLAEDFVVDDDEYSVPLPLYGQNEVRL